ncbi:MAG: hypothetical protein ABW250_19340 [Pyrinomonadaceae bacterium]
MTRRSPSLIAACVALALCAGSGLAQEKRKPSTPEQRRKAVETATLLENDPFNKDAKRLREELLKFLIEAPDVHVVLCTDVLGELSKIKGEYAPIITAQLTFSTAKFVIEHPEQAGDHDAAFLAGVEGVLRAYRNIKKAKPKVKIEQLDDLLGKQEAGDLAFFVKTAAETAGCKSKD